MDRLVVVVLIVRLILRFEGWVLFVVLVDGDDVVDEA